MAGGVRLVANCNCQVSPDMGQLIVNELELTFVKVRAGGLGRNTPTGVELELILQ